MVNFRLRWILGALAGSTAVAVVFELPSLASGNNSTQLLLSSLAQWWTWALFVPMIVAIDQRLPLSREGLASRILAHALSGVGVTALYLYAAAAMRALLGLGAWAEVFRFSLLTNALKGMFLWSWLVYLLIVGGCLVWHYHGRLLRGQLEIERLERQFSEARLQALRMQLDPHFLFNALNTISSQVERDPRLARAMIGHLGDLLRLSLESKDKRVVTLAEELAFLDHYLAIQKIRFGENLSVTIEVDPAVNDALLPALLLQPLVENAIRHGFSRRSRGGCVTVTARGGGDQLQLRVVDDGVGLPARWSLEDSTGLGLSITRERIAGSAGRFSIQNRAEGGAEVTLSLPLRFARREMSAT